MTPRPLYKWKSFWLGILVLGFLGWAWADSMELGSWWTPVDGRVSLFNEGGQVGLQLAPEGWERIQGAWKVMVVDDAAFPAFVDFSSDDFRVRYSVAHWFLMLLFLLPWSAWLFWHWKREQKKPRA